MGILSPKDYKVSEIIYATIAPRDILRGRSILVSIGWKRLSNFTATMRISKPAKLDYCNLLMLLTLAHRDESQMRPFELEDWRMVLVRFQLYDRSNLSSRGYRLCAACWREISIPLELLRVIQPAKLTFWHVLYGAPII